MIECSQATHLFDAYLNEELSPSLTAELHAHVLSCRPCGQELSLLEACGDVVASDRIGPLPGADFTGRVLAASGEARAERQQADRWRRYSLWVGAGAAAAAALLLFLLPVGAPSNPDTLTLGRTVSLGEVDATDLPEPLVQRMMLQTIRAMDATGRGAQALGELGAFGLDEVHGVLQRGLSEPGAWGPAYFEDTNGPSVETPLRDLGRILEAHQRAVGEVGLEVM